MIATLKCAYRDTVNEPASCKSSDESTNVECSDNALTGGKEVSVGHHQPTHQTSHSTQHEAGLPSEDVRDRPGTWRSEGSTKSPKRLREKENAITILRHSTNNITLFLYRCMFFDPHGSKCTHEYLGARA